MTNLQIAKLYLANDATATAATIDAAITAGTAATTITALDNTAFLNAAYQATFGRTADAEGLAYWGDILTAGTKTQTEVMDSLIDGAVAYTGAGYTKADGTTVIAVEEDATLTAEVLATQLTAAQSKVIAEAASDATAIGATVVALVAVVDATTAAAAVVTIDAAEAAVAEAIANAGDTFTLTTSADTNVGTVLNDTFDGTTKNTLNSTDVILDSTATDSDVLNATVTNNSTAARIQNVETINLDGLYVTTGAALTNVTGTTDLNLNTSLSGGTATVTDANSINVANINAGANINTVAVTSLASGTRDTVYVNSNAATGTTITGAATGSDTYDVTIAADSTITLATMNNTSVDAVTINNAGDFTLTSNVTEATDALAITIESAAASTVTLTAGAAETAKSIAISGAATTLAAADASDLDLVSVTGAGATISVTTTIANTDDFSEAVVDNFNVTGTIAGGGVGFTINENTVLNLSGDTTAAGIITVDIDNAAGDATTGTLIANIDASLTTAALTTGAKVDTILVTAGALANDASGNTQTVTIADLTVAAATNTVVLSGDNALTITAFTGNAGDETIIASGMTSALTINDFSQDATVISGAGDDVYSLNSAGSISNGNALTITSGAGDDTVDLFGASGNKAAASTIKTEAGDDTITTSSAGDTIDAGAGDDIINLTATAADTITLGTGADTINMASGNDGQTVTDFAKGEDTLVLTGAGLAIDLTTMVTPSAAGAYANLDTTANFDITLTDVSATDLSDSIQLGSITAAGVKSAYTFTSAAENTATVTIIAGDKDDVIATAMTVGASGTEAGAVNVTLGAGSDTLVLGATVEKTNSDTNTVTVSDFVVGTDKVILESVDATAVATANLDLTATTVATGVVELDVYDVTLNNGGAAAFADTVTDVSTAIQLGSADVTYSAGNFNVTGGVFNDFIKAGGSIISFIDNGGMDTITNFVSAGTDDLSFDDMTGINAGAGNAVAAATVTTDGAVYVMSDNVSIAGDTIDYSKIGTTVNNAVVAVTDDSIMADVAAYIGNALTKETDGENYVAVINDVTGGANEAYAYFVAVDADGIQADDITLIGAITANAALIAADIV